MATRDCSLVVLEVKWSVRDRCSYGWVPEHFPPRLYPTSLVVFGEIRTVVRIRELHLASQIIINKNLVSSIIIDGKFYQ